MEPIFKKCTSSDLEMLQSISKETFISTFEKDNNPVDFQEYVEKAFDREKLKRELENPNSRFYFLFLNDTLVGYFKLNLGAAQTEIRDGNSMELERIYILAEHQGKKLGRLILDTAISFSRNEPGVNYLWLGVWENNQRAIGFYQKNGFRKFGKHFFYIGKDRQTDYLMRLDFQ